MKDRQMLEVIVRHVNKHVGPVKNVLHWPGAEIVHVDILHVPPNRRRPFHTLLTCGMSERPMCPPAQAANDRYAELFLSLPASWPVRRGVVDPKHTWPVRELAELARLPHVNESWVWCGHTVGYPDENDEEPMAPGVPFSAWVIGPHLSLGHTACFVRARGRVIRYHSAIPIYRDELRVARTKGPDALFDRLARAKVSDIIDPRRPNVCARSRKAR